NQEVCLRECCLRLGYGGRIRRRPGEERGGEDLRQASGLVYSANAARVVKPGLGGVRGEGWHGAALPGDRDKEQPVHGRSRRQGEREDRMREGALQGIGGSRDTGSICGGPN